MTATFPGTLKPKPFTVSIPDASLDDLKSLIRLGRLPPATFEGSDRKYGVTNEWMKHAKQYWHDEFNWCFDVLRFVFFLLILGHIGESMKSASIPFLIILSRLRMMTGGTIPSTSSVCSPLGLTPSL